MPAAPAQTPSLRKCRHECLLFTRLLDPQPAPPTSIESIPTIYVLTLTCDAIHTPLPAEMPSPCKGQFPRRLLQDACLSRTDLSAERVLVFCTSIPSGIKYLRISVRASQTSGMNCSGKHIRHPTRLPSNPTLGTEGTGVGCSLSLKDSHLTRRDGRDDGSYTRLLQAQPAPPQSRAGRDLTGSDSQTSCPASCLSHASPLQ